LEVETDYQEFLHGEAVAWGMIAATIIGEATQTTDNVTAQRIIALVMAYAPLPVVDVDSQGIVKRLLTDKKTVGGIPHFILPKGIGKVEVVSSVPDRAVIDAVEKIKKLSRTLC
jgi:3-dehydroquinate synthase